MKDILIKNITELTSEDETYIVENLVEISKGRNSNYNLYTIVVKILQFLENQTEKIRYGAICKCQSKYVKKIQNKNVHFIHLPFGKNL